MLSFSFSFSAFSFLVKFYSSLKASLKSISLSTTLLNDLIQALPKTFTIVGNTTASTFLKSTSKGISLLIIDFTIFIIFHLQKKISSKLISIILQFY